MNRLSRKAVAVAVIAAMLSAGCATKGVDVQASYVPPIRYSKATCAELADELVDVGRKAAELSGQLDSAASKDAALVAVSLVLFWPAIFFVGGDKSKEAQLAQLKGERDALIKAGRANGCKLDDMKPAVNELMLETSNTPQ